MEGPTRQQHETPMAEMSTRIFQDFHTAMLALLANLQQQLSLQQERSAAELESKHTRMLMSSDEKEAGAATAASSVDWESVDDRVPLERFADAAPTNPKELPRLLGAEDTIVTPQASPQGRMLPLSKVRPPALQIPHPAISHSKVLCRGSFSSSPQGVDVQQDASTAYHEDPDDIQVFVANSDRGVPAAPGDGQEPSGDSGGCAGSSADSSANSVTDRTCSAILKASRGRDLRKAVGKPRSSIVSLRSSASKQDMHQYFSDLSKLKRSKSILREFQHHLHVPLDSTLEQQLRVGDMLVQDGILQRFVWNPSSRWRFIWDIFGMLLIGYDAMIIPMQVFELPETAFLLIANWATTCFWTLDVPVAFLTGYHTHGFLEMRPAMIAKRYLRTWLFPDLAVVLMDWTFIAVGLGDTAGVLRFGKSARALRILRALRLLRLMKVIELVAKISDGLNSELLLLVMNILKLVVSVVILNHYIACLWFLITTIGNEADNWARVSGVDTADAGTQYGVALHWSLTQFMPASMEVNPTNVRERYFAIFILIFGLVTFSSFVSSITTVMAQLRNISSDRLTAEANLRQYLNENRVSVDLGLRIRQFFRENYEARRRRVHEVDVIFFESLPETLKVELHKEVYMPVITSHPIFYHYYSVDAAGMWLICHLTMSQQSYVATRTIFLEGEPATEMLFVVTGHLKYFASGHTSPWDVLAGAWLCEAALWLNNSETQGRLEAFTMSELFGISAKKFRAITSERGQPFRYLRRYAKSFMQYAKEVKGRESSALDICEDVQIIQDMADKVFSASFQPACETCSTCSAPRTPRTPLSGRSTGSMRTPPRRFVASAR